MAFTNPGLFKDVRQPPRRNPHAIVVVGGDRYDSWINKQLFRRVTVELGTNQASEATFEVFDPRFKFLDKYADAEGAAQVVVYVYLGFGRELGPPVFKGLLYRVERGDESTTLLVQDMGIRMRQEQKGEYHYNLNDVQIMSKLALRNGLKFEGPEKIDPPIEVHPSMIQDLDNDWDHVRQRARHSGFNYYVRMDTLFCKEPAKLGKPILRLRYRKDFQLLHNFSLTYKLPENEQGRPKVVEWRSRNRGGKRLTGRSGVHSRGNKPVGARHDLAEHTKVEANRRAHAHKEYQREPAWNCTIRSVPPLPNLRPDVRNTIRLENVGNLFSGDYLVENVLHEFTANSFETEYTLYRDIGT